MGRKCIGMQGKEFGSDGNLQLGCFPGADRGAGHFWNAKRKSLGTQSDQSTDCNCLGLDIQELQNRETQARSNSS